MIKRLFHRKRGLRPLLLLASLCIVSVGFRLANGSGAAIASQLANLGSYRELVEDTASCTADAEIEEILSSLNTRQDRLSQREEELAGRQAAMQVAQQKIEEKLLELKKAEDSLREVLVLAEGAAENDISRLTTVYERMKPKEASALFETMAPEFAAGFLGRMNPEAAAQILAGLSPDVAYSLSAILAGRHSQVPVQ